MSERSCLGCYILVGHKSLSVAAFGATVNPVDPSLSLLLKLHSGVHGTTDIPGTSIRSLMAFLKKKKEKKRKREKISTK